MIVSIFALFIILSISFALNIQFRIKQENSVLITFLGIAIFLYLAGLFDVLKLAVYGIYIISIICFIYIIYFIVKKKAKIKELITPATVLYVIVMLVMTKVVLNTYYSEWDEFSHWGPNLKAMLQYDKFWSNNIYDGIHVVYTPLAGLVEYFYCKINHCFAEDISYIAINSFIITLCLPILKKLKWNIKDIVKGVLFWLIVYLLIILFRFKLSSIYIDLLLGILFSIGMSLAYRLDGKEDKISLVMIMLSLPLLKNTGLLLLGIILMQLFFSKVIMPIIEEKKITKKELKKIGILILILVISLTLYGTWNIYCKMNNRELDDRHDKNSISQIDIKSYIKAITLYKIEDGKYKDIANNFYSALNEVEIWGRQSSGVGTVVNILVILNIIGIALYYFNKDEKQKKKILSLFLAFNIGFIMYCLLLLATYMFAFTEQEGRELASYTRYMSTYFIAWILDIISIGIEREKSKGLIIAILAFMLCLYPLNIQEAVNLTSKKNKVGVPQEIIQKADIIKQNVKLDDKIYLIYQNIGGGGAYHMLRYSISPIVTNLLYEWSLGPKYNENDIWNYDISKEEFEKKLIDENYDYVFIAQVDKQFIEIYGDLIEKEEMQKQDVENLNNKLLKVNKKGNGKISLSICN